MSELSAAAAAALGVPETIVLRSAAARSTETGLSVDEVLAAWAGGESAPAPVAAPAEAPTEQAPTTGGEAEPDAPLAEESATPTPEPKVEIPAAADPPILSPRAATTVSGKPPVLIGKADNPLAVLVGAVALFVAVFLVGMVGPALPTENPGARSSELPFTEAAVRGRQIYGSLGCASCHTQMVRPVVADVGLGAVTLDDSNQVLGTRRFGPDLSDVGSRLSGSQIEATVTGLGDHPALSLSQDDLADLAAYLVESTTSVESPDEPPATDDGSTETSEEDAAP
jgi:mono/diheme cytochrome c family protein